MDNSDYFLPLPFPVTICDQSGVIVALNDAAAIQFAHEGGRALIGRNVLDCHSPESSDIIRRILQDGEPNVYTIEKKGRKELIWQGPWYRNGERAGILEMTIPLPDNLPNQVRE